VGNPTIRIRLDKRNVNKESMTRIGAKGQPIVCSRPMSKAEFRRRMNRWIKMSGVTKITPHGVRRTKATRRFMGGCRNMEEARLCARYPGHSATTMPDACGHATDVDEDEILRRLEKMERGPAKTA